MNPLCIANPSSLQKIRRTRKNAYAPELPRDHQTPRSDEIPYPKSYEIKIICIYPSVDAGKLGRKWIKTAFRNMTPHASTSVEYYNFAVLCNDAISWDHVIERIRPDVILMIGDGRSQLIPGFRNSLKELISCSSNRKKPLVIFRGLEPQPTLNTSVLIDYVSTLTARNHCEFNVMNGDGTPISCFRHPRLLLKYRKYRE